MAKETVEFLSTLSIQTLLLIVSTLDSEVHWGFYPDEYRDNLAKEYIHWIIQEWKVRDSCKRQANN